MERGVAAGYIAGPSAVSEWNGVMVGTVLLSTAVALVVSTGVIAVALLWLRHRDIPLQRQLRLLGRVRNVAFLLGGLVFTILLWSAWPFINS